MQGRMLLSVSQTVAGSGGVFFRLKGAAGEQFACSKWEPVASSQATVVPRSVLQ